MAKKLIVIITGISIILFGLFLSVSILLYTIKENDTNGYYYLIASITIKLVGIYILKSDLIKKRKRDINN